MAFLAPLAPLVLPALITGAVSYGVNTFMQHQQQRRAERTPLPTPASRPKPVSPQSTPVGGSYSFEDARLAAASGGDSAIAIDPLGKRGSAGTRTQTTMLGR